ncbi:unnamed protein product [Sphenostylis stenocarpa]|uniref:TIR domain-containing protein n=1 Tax=Sphenostylis stenocarpa TaxID=92480 RepID=A0AA86W515_9FABA|nr:unnamed protein product [Sphenostylis stenocarpa]
MTSDAIIQYTSSSSHTMRTHDVFVSFRGEDTRYSFTGFLFEALGRKGVDAFRDHTHLQKGESIAPELLQAIEGSRVFVVVFSKNYASSTWCLRELAHICNCIETPQRPVLPIFYDVDPSDVRKQSGYYEKAFAEHEERYRDDKERMEEVQRWREALTRVANLSGWDIRNKYAILSHFTMDLNLLCICAIPCISSIFSELCLIFVSDYLTFFIFFFYCRPQYAEIEKIVKSILNMLGNKFSCLPNDNLVGTESRVEELANLLCLESDNDVHVVGVSGMGGIGKTTLTRALYERISCKFDFCCFIDDVSKLYQESSTLGVQKQLLSQCLNEKQLEICNVSKGTCLVWTRLRNGRALIVLDNVDHVGQLKMFTGNRENLLRESLGGGSRIIIISRDEHILRTHGVDYVYQVRPLNLTDAGRLFYHHAFRSNYVKSGYEEYANVILSYVQGHPLAIEVLGSSLFGRGVSQWRSALARLRDYKSKDIMDVLRISFDQLDDTEKEIFLDIACFLNYREVEYVKEVLEFRGFHPEYGLQVLIDKSLIKYERDWKCLSIMMHELLVDLGRCIVRDKAPKEPRKRCRLWDYKDLHKVMSDNTVAENLEAIQVTKWTTESIRADGLSKMNYLQYLNLEGVIFSGELNHLSKELGYLNWDNYPFECLPQTFQPEKLVELSLIDSNIKQLWEGTKPLPNLRRLDLSHSENLTGIPNLCKALNLEAVSLEGCVQLKHIDPSIGFLTKLTVLNLKDCKSLAMLPHFEEAINLENLNLQGCTKLKQIDLSIGLLKRLTLLNLKGCKNLVSSPNSKLGLKSLQYLGITGCSKRFNTKLLDEPSNQLLKMQCEGEEAPANSQSSFSFVKMWPLNLFYSRARKDTSSVLFPSLFGFPCMRDLDLSFCNLLQIPDAIGNLHSLERLNVSGNNFATLPNLKELSKLYYLNLQHCKRLKYLCELPSRTELPSLPSESSPYVIEAGLYIFNCPGLVEREHCTNKGFSWMIQLIQALHKYNISKCGYQIWPPLISSIIPGSEIPRWFHNQHVSMGNLITIEAFPIGNRVGGVACCVVFPACSEERVLWMPPNSIRSGNYVAEIPVDLDVDIVSDKSDHMWLFYLVGHNCRLSKFEIDVIDRQGFTVQVKRYGYSWDTYLTTRNSGNSSGQKRKFSMIEEK